ncbi:MAG: hypothetical protein U0163_18930, partial [Gemmatimonadaceae bacterium]
VLITLTQSITVDIGDEREGERRVMKFRGGCSLIMSLGSLNTVEFVVQKNIRSYRRFLQQVAYANGETDERPASMSLYSDDVRPPRLRFNLLHTGMTR